ncbi:hypothetical protein, partial [Actinomadura sp. WAC 06369]|uniref:hypothetical protein n=1 Tax=Actinomadura sp. WAC 06369 TaxID=2203193 RepID=UPI001F302F84
MASAWLSLVRAARLYCPFAVPDAAVSGLCGGLSTTTPADAATWIAAAFVLLARRVGWGGAVVHWSVGVVAYGVGG